MFKQALQQAADRLKGEVALEATSEAIRAQPDLLTRHLGV